MSGFTLAAMVILLSAIYLHGINGENLQKYSLPSNGDEKVDMHRSTRQIESFRTGDKVQLCDRRLVAELTRLCKSKFPTFAKRNYNENLVTRYRRSITEECCFKPCTRTYLKTFCAHQETPTTPAPSAPVLLKPNTSRQNAWELMRELNALLEKTRAYSAQNRAAGNPINSGNWGNGLTLALVAARPESAEAKSINIDDDGASFDSGMMDDDSSVFFVG